jgi:hypothetical protein
LAGCCLGVWACRSTAQVPRRYVSRCSGGTSAGEAGDYADNVREA